MKTVGAVLWVEDQAEFVDSLKPIVDAISSRIVHVTDAHEAEAAFSSEPFDLILLDLQLPPGRWGGLEFLRRLGSRVGSCPIVVLSGAGTMMECVEALRLGAKDYVQKESARTELASIIRKVIEGFRDSQPLNDYGRICKIERTLKDLVMKVLSNAAAKSGTSIFRSLLPRKVAIKSYERWIDASEGDQEDFLDLLDFAAIIDSQWMQLDAMRPLHAIVAPKNREERVAWLVALNEARKIIAHPTRGELEKNHRKAIDRTEEILGLWEATLGV